MTALVYTVDAAYPKDNLLTITPTITGTAKASAGYSITNGYSLPATLSLDANTGVISGTPTAVGTISIIMTVEGTDGSTVASAQFSIEVKGKCHRLGK